MTSGIHPLKALPAAAVAQWANRLKEEDKTLRERICDYMDRTPSKGKWFFQQLTRLSWQRTMTLKELVDCQLSVHTLFGDEDGIKTSLAELCREKIVTSMEDFEKLEPTAADVLGPFSSKERHERLSPTTLRNFFRDQVKVLLVQRFKLKNVTEILSQYGAYFYPSDYAALGLRFNVNKMREPAQIEVMKQIALSARGGLRAFPFHEWQSVAELKDDYLALLVGSEDPRRVAELKKKIWG